MSQLLSLRIRLVAGIVLAMVVLTGTIFMALNELSAAAQSQNTPDRLRAIDGQVARAVEAEQERLLGAAYAAAGVGPNLDQILAGDESRLLLRLTMTQELAGAWITNSAGRPVAFVGDHEDAINRPEAGELARQAIELGQVGGLLLHKNGAYLAAGVRLPGEFGDRVLFFGQSVDDAFARAVAERTGLQITLFRPRTDGSVERLGTQASALANARLHDVLKPEIVSTLGNGRTLQLADLDPGRAGRLAGSVYFAAIPNGPSIAGQLDKSITLVLAACLATLLILGVGSWLFSRRIVGGLGKLTQLARAHALGKFDATAVVKGHDELVRYAETVNLLGQSLQQRELKIFQTANRDGVTGLPSRTVFETKLSEAVGNARANKKPMALITIAVDRLREVNDSLGRKAGDKMLSEIADRLRKSLRSSKKRSGENFLARLATYEFGIILDRADTDTASRLARRLAEVLDRRVEYDGQSVAPGARIGVAVYPDHGIDSGGLLYSADIAATNAGAEISRVAIFDASFEREREHQVSMLQELRRALDEDELYIALLPKIGLRQGDTLMAEALMRWDHPERGALNPGQFIPFAEKTGFITQLTNWMIEGALKIAATWQAEGRPLTISVNISPRDIESPDFTTYVVERLRAHGLRGSVLTLEVTESAVLKAAPIVRQNLDVLSRLGVKIAIDDFGSGFASLDEFRALPLTYVMIDRQYIDGLASDEASRIIVQSAIDIGHTLGVQVVGEGVETAEQLALLRKMGCDQAQGFYLSKPMTDEQFQRWVVERRDSFAVPADKASSAVAASVSNNAGKPAVADDQALGTFVLDDESMDESLESLGASIELGEPATGGIASSGLDDDAGDLSAELPEAGIEATDAPELAFDVTESVSMEVAELEQDSADDAGLALSLDDDGLGQGIELLPVGAEESKAG